MKPRAKIRLFVDAALGDNLVVPLDQAQAHYLFGVMRQTVGGQVRLFNGVDGEWLAEIVQAGKRKGLLKCVQPGAPLQLPPDLWLVFAPVKKVRTALIVEKAVEMGVARLLPVLTRYTNERFNTDRMRAHVTEAAEQCGITYVPRLEAPQKFETLMRGFPEQRRILFCDESLNAEPAVAALAGQSVGPWAVFVGPEGGFAPEEAQTLRALPRTTPVTLGPRILRADTAVVAALTAWQQALGDWQ